MISNSRLTVWALAGAVLGLAVGVTAVANPTREPNSPGNTISVSSSQELADALADAKPGDTIQLAAGDYSGSFAATVKGTEREPITLSGTPQSVLSNSGGYGLRLDGAAHWNLTGFSVAEAKKGIVLDSSNRVVIDDVEVSRIDEEAVHFRKSSSDNVIQDSRIHDTGLKKPQFGEGIYFGSAQSNWEKYGEDKGPDRSNRNQALNNKLGPGITAEHIDIKEGTEDGVVRGNTFDGQGVSGKNSADSWLDVKGNGYLIEANTGTFGGDGALVDGYQTNVIVNGWGCGNVFRANDSNLGGAEGYAIKVVDQDECGSVPNVVYRDNKVRYAGRGLTNIEVTD
ncbi:hypothetical protein GCM10023080_015960 [Streptomyces pseudoechinosporeus]